ncbi:DUF3987 domain-containing protein [Mesonia phycicola]|nr:DUF3987 domain-containing protein [Mesonia phycicola]
MATVQNGFPLEIFPLVIQNLINNAFETKCFNRDYFSTAILSTCATSIGNAVSLFNGTYSVKPILWLAIVGDRGTGKTHPLDYAKKPLSLKDDEAYNTYEQELKAYDEQNDNSGLKKPKYNHTILNDFTPEIIAQTLKYNDKGILILKDELMGWINSFDSSKRGGEQQMYLELFNGNVLTVDRVTKDPIRINASNVNILGGMQPQKLKEFASNHRVEDGFIDRFLFTLPSSLKPILFTGKTIPEDLENDYIKWINNLLEVPELTITVNEECHLIHAKWQHHKAKVYFNDALENAIQKKLETYVWRLALVIEIMNQGVDRCFNDDLQPSSIKKAINLVEYFRENAFKVHDKILSKNPFDSLTAIQLDFYNRLPQEFKRSEVLSIAKELDISIRTVDRFFHYDYLFKKIKNGVYRKKL